MLTQRWLIRDTRDDKVVARYEGARIDPVGIAQEFCQWKGILLEFWSCYVAEKATEGEWVAHGGERPGA